MASLGSNNAFVFGFILFSPHLLCLMCVIAVQVVEL